MAGARENPIRVVKSTYVRAQDPGGVRRGRPAASLPLKVAGFVFHAELHERYRLRRHSAGVRRADGDWQHRATRSTQRRNGRLVSPEKLSAEGSFPDRNGSHLITLAVALAS